MRISHFTALLLACVLLFLPTVGLAVPSSLSVAVVADDHLALRPLELNQRDVVSLLGLVYEGLFEMDDNAQPQPKLAYADVYKRQVYCLYLLPVQGGFTHGLLSLSD